MSHAMREDFILSAPGACIVLDCLCVSAGYGLHCHRAVITLSRLIGVKDMYCKVEGSVNLLNITRALFTGLANQVRSFRHERYGSLARLGKKTTSA